jgi:hypothetical protein
MISADEYYGRSYNASISANFTIMRDTKLYRLIPDNSSRIAKFKDARTLPLSATWKVYVDAAETLAVNNFDDVLISTITASGLGIFTLIDNSTSAGSWLPVVKSSFSRSAFI